MTPLESLVTDLELSKRLCEAGIAKESVFQWWFYPNYKPNWRLKNPEELKKSGFLGDSHTLEIPALNVEELAKIIPFASIERFNCNSLEYFSNVYGRPQPKGHKTILGSLCELAGWMLDNNYFQR